MKKFLSAALTLTIAVSAALPAFAANDTATPKTSASDFKDISDPSYKWAYSYIDDMVKRGYITGYEDKTFRPDNSVTRLEVLALFSRSLGAKEELNEPVVKLAVEQYGKVISSYSLPWGEEEIAFLMYRDVLKESDLTTYLKGELKNQPMPRYEAAIIITKAMGGEAEATKDPGVVLDYKDQKDIPTAALQYVAYVSDKGIMQGMEDGSFSPNSSVLRSQMAVMLSRTVDKTDYTFKKAKIQEIDTTGRILSYTTSDGQNSKVTYTDNVQMNVQGTRTLPKEVPAGVDAVLTLTGTKVAFVDTLASVPDEQFTGKYSGRATSGGVTRVTLTRTDTNERVTYDCAPDLSVTYNGSPSALTNFKEGDFITVNMSDGKITKIAGETRTVTITGAKVENIATDPDFTMTISHAKEEYDGNTYPIDTNATVTKNGESVNFSEVYVGDSVSLTLEYGVITKVSATSSTKTVEGTIQELIISSQPTITLRVKGEDTKYTITNDVEITVNGNKGTLYDFRVGDSVKLTLESQAVKKIVAVTAQASSGTITGTITAVNSAYGFIKVAYKTTDGYNAEETVYCKDNTTTIITDNGVNKKIKDLKEGQLVTAHGTTSNGAFSAKVIVVTEATVN